MLWQFRHYPAMCIGRAKYRCNECEKCRTNGEAFRAIASKTLNIKLCFSSWSAINDGVTWIIHISHKYMIVDDSQRRIECLWAVVQVHLYCSVHIENRRRGVVALQWFLVQMGRRLLHSLGKIAPYQSEIIPINLVISKIALKIITSFVLKNLHWKI